MQWFRFHHTTIDDSRLRRIARLVDEVPATVLGVWTIILTFASLSHKRGELWLSPGVPVALVDISEVAGFDVEEIIAGLSQMGLLTEWLHNERTTLWAVTEWDRQQFTSDSSALRMRQFRARQQVAEEDE